MPIAKGHLPVASLAVVSLLVLVRCSSADRLDEGPRPPAGPDADADASSPSANAAWRLLASDEPSAFLAVSSSSERDVWIVGADKGQGPSVLHFDGAAWARVPVPHRGDFWWVHAAPKGQATYFGGSEGAIFSTVDGAAFVRERTPALGKQTVFGVWSSPDGDVWAVGGAAGRDGFVWRKPRGGDRFLPVRLPANLPRRADGELPALLKVWGDGHGAVYVVGDRGTVLRSRNDGPLEVVASATTERLFTGHGAGATFVTVGGTGSGVILEGALGGSAAPFFTSVAPEATPLLQGVHLGEDGEGWAVGQRGSILRRSPDGRWTTTAHGLAVTIESLHAVHRDAAGGVWAVGGNVLSEALDRGAVLHFGAAVPPIPRLREAPPAMPVCPAGEIDPAPTASIARRWNEQILGAIRRDLPRPGIHARNLFHVSAAMWDAWAAYEPTADGWLVRDKVTATDVAEVAMKRAEAISLAAYRILEHRYAEAVGGGASVACFDALLSKLGLDSKDTSETGESGRALGNRIARRYIERYADDGANEAANYADTSGWTSDNAPLVVDEPSTTAAAIGRWQPLNLAQAVTQNGIVVPAGVQKYVCPHWGLVAPFALVRPAPGAVYDDPGPGPGSDLAKLRTYALEVIEKTSRLDPASDATIDISPGAYGNNTLGANDGSGHPLNPVTGAPYGPNVVSLADFGRVLAEHWADGPKSETPPGHWNVIANRVADDARLTRAVFGDGPVLDPLAWDVMTYFTLNGALHDAAIAAWELKRRDVSSRPITLVRVMGSKGQSTDPAAPSYSPEGLPLVPGLVELVTSESVASGRHADLAPFVGQVAVKAWRGEPGDRKNDVGGVAFIRATEWQPYQRRTFVTPAFPGFVSGHSTFSRAAAEVLAALTGSPYFPGGYAFYEAKQDAYLTFERGPSTTVRLEWATYYDAADQAGQSRLWGGIHIEPDDLRGREVGRRVGLKAVDLARRFFEGTATP